MLCCLCVHLNINMLNMNYESTILKILCRNGTIFFSGFTVLGKNSVIQIHQDFSSRYKETSFHSIVQASRSVFQTLRYRGRGGERHRQRSGRHSSHNDNIQVADRRQSLQDSSQVWNDHHKVRYLRQRGQKTHILTKSLNPK